jgi:hypothetical protein
VNMRLMKSSFGHAFMVMGSRGTALYPRDESMRYRGDPTGERLTHAEMEQKVRLERCFGGRSQPGPKKGGRMPIKGPAPVPEGAAPDYGPVGSRRPPPTRTVMTPPAPPRGAAPPPIRMPFGRPSAPPPAKPGRARARGEGARRNGWPATTEANASPAIWNARLIAATGTYGPGAEIGPHDGADGAGNATSV